MLTMGRLCKPFSADIQEALKKIANLRHWTNRADVERLTKYWNHGFDWRNQEAELNKLAHFKTEIEVDDFGTLDMHFVHERSKVKGAIPLLFVHGCRYMNF